MAVWLYGNVARGQDRKTSDVDIAVVGEPGTVPRIGETAREALWAAEDRLAFTASVVSIDTEDVLRLSAKNDPWWVDLACAAVQITGEPPADLLVRLRRQIEGKQRKGRLPRTRALTGRGGEELA